MEYSYRYRASPPDDIAAALQRHIDIHRQAYNYTRYQHVHTDVGGSAYAHHKQLTEWKREFPIFAEVHSKALQRTVTRFYQNLSTLSAQRENGQRVGMLNWKPPREFQSMTYSQSGFELKDTSGRTATLWLSKIGDIPIRYHRPLPDEAVIKEVTVKKETTGEWFVSFGLDMADDDLPAKPPVESLEAGDVVGVDLGIENYIYTSDGHSVDWLDLSDEYDRLRREQRKLSRKDHGSANWTKQRRRVAAANRRIKRTVLDFQHKLTTWLVSEYDAVVVENLDVKSMLEGPQNARNKQAAAWGRFTDLLEYKAELYGCHVVEVAPAGTTKECAQCGVATDKPLWVREHSCPSCGFEVDRDANAAMNVLQRGVEQLGLGWSEGTPAETVAAVGDDPDGSVSARHVVETGSPTLRERTAHAVSE